MSPKAHAAGLCEMRQTDSGLQLFFLHHLHGVRDARKDTLYLLKLQKQSVYIVYQKVGKKGSSDYFDLISLKDFITLAFVLQQANRIFCLAVSLSRD